MQSYKQALLYGFLVALTTLSSVHVAAQEDELPPPAWTDQELKILTSENFTQEVGKHDISGVFFYAPWCGYCKEAKPSWQSVAKKLEQSGINLFIVNGDDRMNEALMKKYKIEGFPSIRAFKKGNLNRPFVFDGIPGDTNSLLRFITRAGRQASKALKEIQHKDDHEHNRLAEVYAFVEDFESEDCATFKRVAERFKIKANFYHTKNLEIAETVTDSKVSIPSVVMRRFYDGESFILKDDFTEDALEDFFNRHYVPSFFNYDKDYPYLMELLGDGSTETEKLFIHIIADNEKFLDMREWVKKLPEELYEKIGSSVLFSERTPDGTSEFEEKFEFEGGVEETKLIVSSLITPEKYIMRGEVTPKNAVKFIQDVVEGKVKPDLKSAEPPADDDGPVKTVVGSTLNDFLGTGKNIFFKFYAPWCGYCQQLEPTIVELGKKYKDDEDVIIAKMDCTVNDLVHPVMNVMEGFPAIYFVSAQGEIEEYMEVTKRELSDFSAFIEEHRKPVTAGVKVEL